MMTNRFEPRIIGFLCNWCAYECADALGRSRMVIPSNFYIVRMMCAGRFEPKVILEAFRRGADGVAVMGCHPGECHYQSGNIQALKRFTLLRYTLAPFGIAPERLRIELVAPGDKDRLSRVIQEMCDDMTSLGPLTMP